MINFILLYIDKFIYLNISFYIININIIFYLNIDEFFIHASDYKYMKNIHSLYFLSIIVTV